MTDYTTPPPPPPPPGPPGGFPPPPPGGNFPPPPPGGGGFQGGYGGPDKPQNAFNIVSLVLGIVSILCCCFFAGFWAGIPAIVFGFLGMKKADQGLATNKTLGLVGLILGGVGIALTIVAIILRIVSPTTVDWTKINR